MNAFSAEPRYVRKFLFFAEKGEPRGGSIPTTYDDPRSEPDESKGQKSLRGVSLSFGCIGIALGHVRAEPVLGENHRQLKPNRYV